MGYKVFDFECPSCKRTQEFMVKENEILSCHDCICDMIKIATCTRAKGRISTYNPFKAGGRKAHRVRNPFNPIDSNHD